jgi:hypothetical protein
VLGCRVIENNKYKYVYKIYAYTSYIQMFARMKVRCGMSGRWAEYLVRVREGRDM